MKKVLLWLGSGLLALSLAAQEEKIPLFSVRGEHYTNVTVLDKTASEIFIRYTGGATSLKLKDLPAEWQTRFGYDPEKAQALEKERAEAAARLQAALAQPPPASAEETEDVEKPAEKIWAKRFLGEKAPALEAETWLTTRPELEGKFVLVNFWATWCGPCRKVIPELNEIHRKFGDRVVVIGLADEPEETVRSMDDPAQEYFVATAPQGRTKQAFAVENIPHAFLMSPDGIVRWEGYPLLPTHELKADVVEKILKKYGP